jgi:serine/threonine protein kinase
MVTGSGQVKIMDFGLAKIGGGAHLTKSGTTVGTLAYMSPEQLHGEKVDHRTDIWSFGVVLYEMLARQLPFLGEYEQAVIYSILHKEPHELPSPQSDLERTAQRIILRCLEKDCSSRYQDAGEIIRDLREINRTDVSSVRSAGQMKSRRSAWTYALAGIIAAATLGVLGYVLMGGRAESRERIPVAVADFVNYTGEKELDALSGMLITALEQSRKLSVLPRSRMFDVLQQLNKQDAAVIDENLGREICRRRCRCSCAQRFLVLNTKARATRPGNNTRNSSSSGNALTRICRS